MREHFDPGAAQFVQYGTGSRLDRRFNGCTKTHALSQAARSYADQYDVSRWTTR